MEDEQIWIELVLDAGIPYDEYIKQPMPLIEAHVARLFARGASTKKEK